MKNRNQFTNQIIYGAFIVSISVLLITLSGCFVSSTHLANKDVQVRKSETLYDAAVRGDLALVMKELERGADPNGIHRSIPEIPIVGAAREGRLKIIKLLIEHGADKERGDLAGCTALHMAAWKGHLEIVRYLVREGMKIDVKDKDGDTPLMFAVSEVNMRVAKWLIDNGANPEISTNNGRRSIHWAAYRGQTSMVRFLFELGVDINSVDHAGRSPLILAIIANHTETARELIALGANSKIKDRYGRTARNWAQLVGMNELF
jgi:ankyrin repeat protein